MFCRDLRNRLRLGDREEGWPVCGRLTSHESRIVALWMPISTFSIYTWTWPIWVLISPTSSSGRVRIQYRTSIINYAVMRRGVRVWYCKGLGVSWSKMVFSERETKLSSDSVKMTIKGPQETKSSVEPVRSSHETDYWHDKLSSNSDGEDSEDDLRRQHTRDKATV